jgi:hypothetical protein
MGYRSRDGSHGIIRGITLIPVIGLRPFYMTRTPTSILLLPHQQRIKRGRPKGGITIFSHLHPAKPRKSASGTARFFSGERK